MAHASDTVNHGPAFRLALTRDGLPVSLLDAVYAAAAGEDPSAYAAHLVAQLQATDAPNSGGGE